MKKNKNYVIEIVFSDKLHIFIDLLHYIEIQSNIYIILTEILFSCNNVHFELNAVHITFVDAHCEHFVFLVTLFALSKTMRTMRNIKVHFI